MTSSRAKYSISSKSREDFDDDLYQENEVKREKKHELVSKHRPSYFTPKIKFTPDEDVLLLNAVKSLGVGDWHVIASRIPGRNPRQCRERWNNYVNPSLISSPWTTKEDEFLLEKYQELGPHWHTIASYFTSRSTNSIKNRFIILQRRQKRKGNHKTKDRKAISRNIFHMPKNVNLGIDVEKVSNFNSQESKKLNQTLLQSYESDFEIKRDNVTIISDQEKESEEKKETKTKESKDPLQFLEILKDFDDFTWSNDFDPISSNWFGVSYF